MIHSIARILLIVSVAGCVSSSIYYLICLWSAIAFLRQPKAAGTAYLELPPVSILKPLKGIDPNIYDGFRSHCVQDYVAYEIIFGVSDADDPAVASVRQLQREFPNVEIQLVVCTGKLGANVKVSNLEQMMRSARYQHMIVNDSDIKVERDYLRRVIGPLGDPRVGVVTCLYRGIAAATLASRFESLGISADFCPGVLVARQIEGGMRFGLGSTLAFRRADLERAGGFKAFVDFLADDYELGRRIADLGFEVRLSDVVVETHLPAYDLGGFWSHQLRWARGVRDARAGGYAGLIFTFGVMWALLGLIASQGAAWSWVVAGVVMFLRIAVPLVVGRVVLQDRQVLKSLWLIPFRDLIGVAVWAVSFAGHTVTWRGDRFRLKNGRLIRIPS
jgi:ceramide glucosyltransferase